MIRPMSGKRSVSAFAASASLISVISKLFFAVYRHAIAAFEKLTSHLAYAVLSAELVHSRYGEHDVTQLPNEPDLLPKPFRDTTVVRV